MADYIRLDSLGGASGDMLLGVLIGLGADRARLEAMLRKLVPDHFHLHCEEGLSHGLAGLRVTVDIHEHDHGHEHEHHHDHEHEHEHRKFRDIAELIRRGGLPEKVEKKTLEIFTLLARAEGRVHGLPPEEVAFHEVGAVDSIVDIAGCAAAMDMLGVDAFSFDAIPTGSGSVSCAHGVMPVPAPATLEILRETGLPVIPGGERFELLTPTGAAVLASFRRVAFTGGVCAATVQALGQRELDHTPNLLRGALWRPGLAESVPASAPGAGVWEIACNLDDLTPELAGALTQKLLAEGALDVWTIPVLMKKQRPGMQIGLLAADCAARDRLIDMVFRESTAFGVRFHRVERTMLDRSFATVKTRFGELKIKLGTRHGELLSATPEYEDCLEAARQCGVPLKQVYLEAMRAAPSRPGQPSI